MRYAKIVPFEVCNGEGIGYSLFVQGCDFHCNGCFNQEAWGFDGGNEWNEETKETFIKLASRPYIKRISILGGEPLADENINDVLDLINEIRLSFPQKTIWLYSGYTWEEIMFPVVTDNINPKRDKIIHNRREILSKCDVFVDGKYIDSKRDVTLKWRGSSNQRVIDVKKTLQKEKVILYCD